MDEVAKAFISHYYQAFQKDRASLGPLYQQTSMLTWEGVQCLGVQQIIEKLQSLPFKQVGFNILTHDVQPGARENSVLVFVTGQLAVDEDVDKPHFFSHVFQLIGTGPNTFYVHNEVFRRVSLT